MAGARVAAAHADAPLVLALDLGSSSVRAVLFDSSGRMVEGSLAAEGYVWTMPEPGAAEADPDDLVERLFRCIDRVLASAGPLAGRIVGVAATTMVTNVLGVGAHGRAVTPLYPYTDDRSEPDAAQLRQEADDAAIHNRTGCHLHTSYLPPRFRWLARTQPSRFRKARKWMSIGEYLFLRLFRQSPVSFSVASWSGLLDRSRLIWDPGVFALLPVRIDQFSPLIDQDQAVTHLEEAFASRWPALRDVPWFPAIGDGAAANVGSGCLSPRRMALSVGTSAAIRVITADPAEHLPQALFCYRLDRSRSILGGALTEGGNVFGWMTTTMRLGDTDPLEQALATMAPDSHGLTVLPFFSGERSPGWSSRARATLHGLSLRTTAIDILRAGLEAVALRLALVYEEMRKVDAESGELVASGSAVLNSPAWLQIIADALGAPVIASGVTEASARGAALLALEALGELTDVGQAPAYLGEIYEPDTARHARYREALERQRALYRALIQQP